MEILKSIQQLSIESLVTILSNHVHVVLESCEDRDDLEQVLLMNVQNGLIDEIEIILELNAN